MESDYGGQFWLLDLLVNPLESSLTSGSGEVGHLQKKPMEVLVVLAQAQGKVVPSDQIVDRVWGKQSGGDEGLKRCIHAIRKALNDTSANPRFIRTIRGRGYACIPLPSFDTTALDPDEGGQTPPGMPRVELEQVRTITVVSVILSAREDTSQAGELVVPVDLLKQYLDVVETYENAHAYDIGIMSTIIFGLGLTRDDDQLAAVECSAALLEATSTCPNLCARIGIASETITVPSLEQFSKPIALNMKVIRTAAGLAATAATDEINLCEVTAELCRGRSGSLPSITDGVALRMPQKPTAAARRLPFTRHFGRDVEYENLLSCWSRVSVGEGLVAYISGEAGIGKTSLSQRLVRGISESKPLTVLECHSHPRSSKIPLHPIMRCISDSFGIDQAGDATERARLVEERVRQLGFSDPIAAQVLADFLRVEITENRRMADPGPGMRRNLLNEVLTRALIQTSDQPRLLVFEDIHWADHASIELLDQLIDRCPIARMMILITGRSEMRPQWINHALVTHINLRELDTVESAKIVRQLDTRKLLTDDAVARIIDTAAGNPLFLTEVTKSAIASQNPEAKLSELLSTSVRQVLLSRVDTLGADKETLRYAAIVGTHFDLDSLQALMSNASSDIEKSLKKLRDVNMVRQTSSYPRIIYSFNHNLLQTAVYESVPESTRKATHLRLAEHIENSSAQVEKDFLAYHFEAAEQFEKATRYWLQAANRAKQHSLFTPANHHYARALDTLGHLDLNATRDELELQIRIEYGPVLMALFGYAHEDVKANYLQAERLTEILASRDSYFVPQALFGLWTYRVVNGDLHLAKALGEELFELASRNGDEELEMEANVMVGCTQTHMGEFDGALKKLHSAIATYDPTKHAAHKFLFGQDPGMAASVYCGVAYGEMGEPERAQEYMDQGLIIARSSEHVPTLCFALMLSARSALSEGQLEISALRAKECYELAVGNGFPIWVASGKFLIEATQFAQKPDTETAGRMAESREMCKLVGHSLSHLDFASTLAEAYMDLGDLAAAQLVLSEAKAELDRRVRSADERSVLEAVSRFEKLKNGEAPNTVGSK